MAGKHFNYRLLERENDNDLYKLLHEIREWKPKECDRGRYDKPPFPVRIVFFGKSGSGKSSLLNSLNWVAKFQGSKKSGLFESTVPCTPGGLEKTAVGGNTMRLLKLNVTDNMELVDTRGFQTTGYDVRSVIKIICKGYGRFNEDMEWKPPLWKRYLYPLFYDFTRKMDFAVFIVSANNQDYLEECKALIKPAITAGIGCAPLIVVTSGDKLTPPKKKEMHGYLTSLTGAPRLVFVENYLAGMNRLTVRRVDIEKHTELCEVFKNIQIDYDHYLTGVYEHRNQHRQSFLKPALLLVLLLMLGSWLTGLHTIFDGIARDCSDLGLLAESRLHSIKPDAGEPFNAYCDMTTDGGGWTVFQRNRNGSDVLNKTWEEYKLGFEVGDSDHWLGNEKIHRLTANGKHELRIDLTSFDNGTRFALYEYFMVGNDNDGTGRFYRLHMGRYSGDAGDSLTCHNGVSFSTQDVNDPHSRHKWWWLRDCLHSNLNYGSDGISWEHFTNKTLKSSEMKIRRNVLKYYYIFGSYAILNWPTLLLVLLGIITITITIIVIKHKFK